MNLQRPVLLTATVILVGLSAACGSDAAAPSAQTSPSAASSAPVEASPTAEATVKGGYVDYAQYSADPMAYALGDVVLFFNATWCPTCQEATGNLEDASFPEGLTVVSVDYDSNLDLRKQYGVTTQHTFVQVDADGEELATFTGATTVEQIQDGLA